MTGFSDFHKITVTVLKTEYVKAYLIQINYRDYKNYNPTLYGEELRNTLNGDMESSNNYNNFQNILYEVLNKHAHKRKYLISFHDNEWVSIQKWVP